MKYYKHPETGEVYAYDNDQVEQGWVKEGLVEMTQEEVESHLNPPPEPPTEGDIRAKRERLLQETDWTLLRALETGDSVPTEWSVYRQALRDVPQQPGFPEDVEWPELPQE